MISHDGCLNKVMDKKEDIYAEKRAKALEFLGNNWVLHPNYKFNPKHSVIGSDTAKFAAMRTQRTLKGEV